MRRHSLPLHFARRRSRDAVDDVDDAGDFERGEVLLAVVYNISVRKLTRRHYGYAHELAVLDVGHAVDNGFGNRRVL
jgi:hypothetical protein